MTSRLAGRKKTYDYGASRNAGKFLSSFEKKKNEDLHPSFITKQQQQQQTRDIPKARASFLL